MDTRLELPTWQPAPRRRWAPAAVLGVHVLAIAALLQAGVVQRSLKEAAPLLVSIVSSATPLAAPPSLPRPEAPAAPPAMAPLALPEVALAPPSPSPTQRELAPAEPVPAPPAAHTAPSAAPAPPAPVVALVAPPPAPATPLLVAPGALRYLVEPPVQVPRLSRRLHESGTVLLKVVVDVRGAPRSVSLRQSSGYPRLDEQALAAMRQARFVPCTGTDGQPVECESVAPIVYELE